MKVSLRFHSVLSHPAKIRFRVSPHPAEIYSQSHISFFYPFLLRSDFSFHFISPISSSGRTVSCFFSHKSQFHELRLAAGPGRDVPSRRDLVLSHEVLSYIPFHEIKSGSVLSHKIRLQSHPISLNKASVLSCPTK